MPVKLFGYSWKIKTAHRGHVPDSLALARQSRRNTAVPRAHRHNGERYGWRRLSPPVAQHVVCCGICSFAAIRTAFPGRHSCLVFPSVLSIFAVLFLFVSMPFFKKKTCRGQSKTQKNKDDLILLTSVIDLDLLLLNEGPVSQTFEFKLSRKINTKLDYFSSNISKILMRRQLHLSSA